MEFCPNKNYFDDIRNTTQDAINYAIQNQQELVDKALTQTEKIRYSKHVNGLGPLSPFFSPSLRDKDALLPLYDTPGRFRSGDYTAYHLDQSGNLLLIQYFLQHKLSAEYILFERQGIEFAVLFSHGFGHGYDDSFSTYCMIIKDGRPQESFVMNNLWLWGEHIDWGWHEDSGNGYLLCSSFTYPTYNPQAPGQPAYSMDRYRFVIMDDHLSDVVLEMKNKVFPA